MPDKMPRRPIACLWIAAVLCTSAHAAASADTTSTGAGTLVFTKATDGFVRALCFCDRHLHAARPPVDCKDLYDRGRARWIGVELGPSDSAAGGTVQTAWPRDALLPPPSVAFSAWVLALVVGGFGVVAAPTLSPDLAQEALDLGCLVFAECNNDLRWVTHMRGRRARQPLALSDGTLATCDHGACRMDGLRQWVIVSALPQQACALIAPRPNAKGGHPAQAFWYPALLDRYLAQVNRGHTAHPLADAAEAPACVKSAR